MRQSPGILLTVSLLVLLWPSATTVSASPYSVAVRTNRDAYVAGEYVEISGFVTDLENRSISTLVEVAVFSPENASILMDVTHSNLNGYFFTLLSLPPNASLGTYLVTATAEGSPARTAFEVALNAITCLVNSSLTYPVMPILVFGHIHPARSVELMLQFSRNDGDWQTMTHIISDSDGSYSYIWTTSNEVGNYSIMTSYGGINSTLASLRVFIKEPTSITLSLSSSTIALGLVARLQGILNSTSRNATIAIQYRNPEGAVLGHIVQADPQGAFRDEFWPDEEGTWTISATWPGDALNQRATSLDVTLVVYSPPPTMLLLSIVAVEDIVVLAILARQVVKKRRAMRRQSNFSLLYNF